MFGGPVERFQVGQFTAQLALTFLGFLLLQIREKHAELCAPITHMILANHGVTEKFQSTHHGVADDGGAQVAHVHFFGQVG